MDLLKQINNNLKQAMKSKDEIKVSTLRMLKSQIKNQEIKKGKELADDDIVGIISKQIKQRKDSIVQYESAKREDLAKKEQAEIEILKPYLPKQISKEEIQKIIDDVIQSTSAQTIADIGKVMPQVLSKTKGKADNSQIAQMVKSKLQSL